MSFLLLFVSFLYLGNCNSLSPVYRISNGKSAKIERFPYMAALELCKKHHCGAAIIGEYTLITAAHCFLDGTNPKQYQVRVGSYKREADGHVLKVKYIKKNEQYGSSDEEYLKYTGDVAIVWVFNKMIPGKNIQVVALPSKTDKVPFLKTGYVTGWGRTSEKSKKSKELLYAKIPIWDQASCRISLSKGKIGEDMFCAGHLEKQRDTCAGDSGGPFVVEATLYGIVSWGHGCGRKGIPGVYASVIHHLPWIESTVKAGAPPS